MISNLDPGSEFFLSQSGRIQQRLADANRQVSSGKKLNTPADGPDEIAALLQLRSDRQRNTQIQSNLTLAQTGADAADQALSSSIKLMDRALVLANQGANTTLDSSGRASLATEVGSVLNQMVAYSRTTVQGRYIFSGDQSSDPAYSIDDTGTVTQLSNAPATARIEDPAGGSFAAAKAAQEIFDFRNSDGTPASGNVFAALSALQTALQNDDPVAAGASIGGLREASAHLNSMESFYGGVQNRIQDAVTFAGQYDIQLQTQISQKEDADVTAAALEVTQANTQIQAAFEMRAKLPHTSLFDFLG